ncbi:MAG: hypothetical protein ACOCYP_02050 [Planctomycetota bacterium]
MLTGLRASDGPLLQQLCSGDRRLLMRLGALLQERFALTELVLQEAGSDSDLRALVMDRGLSATAEDEPAFHALCERHHCGELGLSVTRGETADDGTTWHVLAFADEVDNPLTAPVEPGAGPPAGVAALLPSLSQQVRGPIEGLLAATADDQRAAALEQLRYAGPDLGVIAELMPMVLADGAELVRERAISLLVQAGARPLVIDLIRALQKDDDRSIRRLADNLRNLPHEQIDLVVAAMLAMLGRNAVTPGIVHLATTIAPQLAHHRGLARLLELMLPHANRISLIGMIRALQQHNPQTVTPTLRELMGQGDELDARLIVLQASQTGVDRAALLARGVDLLLAPGPEPTDRMALAASLRQLDADGELAHRIASHDTPLCDLRDNTVFWLLADLARSERIAPDDGETLLRQIRDLLADVRGPHVLTVLEQRLPVLLPGEPATRAQMVPPLCELSVRFNTDRGRDLIIYNIIDIGQPAIAPCWTLLEESPHRRVRDIAVEVLPELLQDAGPDCIGAAVDRLLQRMEHTREQTESGRLLWAAARLATAPAVDGDGDLVTRVDAHSSALGLHAVPAWGHLAASPAIDPVRRSAILDHLLTGLKARVPDARTEQTVDEQTQEVLYVLDARLGAHTENVPAIIIALEHIGRSPHLPPQMLRYLTRQLCNQWREVSSWKVIWGPANAQLLGRCLCRLAELPQLPGSLRFQIADTLLPRASNLTIALELSRIFAITGPDAGKMGELAGRAAHNLIQAATANSFADDEIPQLAEVLAAFILVPDLGPDGEITRRRLIALLGGYRSQIGQRTRERLRAALSEPDPGPLIADLRERLDWLAPFD